MCPRPHLTLTRALLSATLAAFALSASACDQPVSATPHRAAPAAAALPAASPAPPAAPTPPASAPAPAAPTVAPPAHIAEDTPSPPAPEDAPTDGDDHGHGHDHDHYAALAADPDGRVEPVSPPSLLDALPVPQTPVQRAITLAQGELGAHIDAAKPRWWACYGGKTHWNKLAKPPEPDSIQAKRIDRVWRTSYRLRQRMGYDLEHWRKMRPLYIKRGICNLKHFVLDGITTIDFLGHTMRVHVEVAKRLKRAEPRLVSMIPEDGSPTFDRLGGFHPRTTRGPFGVGKNLSRHGLGIAVDFDWHLNPYLSRAEITVVEHVTGVKLTRDASIPAGKRWDIFDRANTLWLERIDAWLTETEQTLRTWKHTRRNQNAFAHLRRMYNLARTTQNLTRAQTDGFLSLPRDFVVELERAGLTWATDFGSGADLMHFELRDHTPKRTPRSIKGLKQQRDRAQKKRERLEQQRARIEQRRALAAQRQEEARQRREEAKRRREEAKRRRKEAQQRR